MVVMPANPKYRKFVIERVMGTFRIYENEEDGLFKTNAKPIGKDYVTFEDAKKACDKLNKKYYTNK